MLGIFEAEAVGDVTGGAVGGQQQVLGAVDEIGMDVLLGVLPCLGAQVVGQVVGRHVEGIGDVARRDEGDNSSLGVVLLDSLADAQQDVGLYALTGTELASVEPLRVVHQHVDERDDDGLCVLVDVAPVLVLQVLHQVLDGLALRVADVQGLVHLVTEEPQALDALSEGVATDEVGMERQHPAPARRVGLGIAPAVQLTRGEERQGTATEVVVVPSVLRRAGRAVLDDHGVEVQFHGLLWRHEVAYIRQAAEAHQRMTGCGTSEHVGIVLDGVDAYYVVHSGAKLRKKSENDGFLSQIILAGLFAVVPDALLAVC